MKKIILSLLVLMFAVSLVSASDYYVVQHEYYDGDDMVRKSYHYFDKDYKENEDRYSVNDYRHGYTYRTSKKYLDDVDEEFDKDYKKSTRKYSKYKDEWKYSYEHYKQVKYDKYSKSSKDSYRVEYIPYLGGYDVKKCYDSAPEGKLFYIKC